MFLSCRAKNSGHSQRVPGSRLGFPSLAIRLVKKNARPFLGGKAGRRRDKLDLHAGGLGRRGAAKLFHQRPDVFELVAALPGVFGGGFAAFEHDGAAHKAQSAEQDVSVLLTEFYVQGFAHGRDCLLEIRHCAGIVP